MISEHQKRVVSGLIYAMLMLGTALVNFWAYGVLLTLFLFIAVWEMHRLSNSFETLVRLVCIAILCVSFGSMFYMRFEFGPELTLVFLIAAFSFDTASYYAGRVIGGPKLIPKTSPNKTWSGLVGGMLSLTAVFYAYEFALYFLAWAPLTIAFVRPIPFALIAGCVFSILFLFGDLSISYIKRLAGKKDAGGILPGHGGILDRMDSLLIASPLALNYLIVTS